MTKYREVSWFTIAIWGILALSGIVTTLYFIASHS